LTPPEALTIAADSVPVKVGDAENTREPVPVSSVIADTKLADVGVAKNVAMLAARPDTPVEIGNPVQLVSVPDDGVPRAGVTRVGLVANTNEPDPVSSVTADAKFADDGVVKNEVTPVPAPVSVPALVVTVAKLNVPDPLVTSACPLVPSALGSVRVVIPDRLSGAFNVIKSVPLLVPSTKFTPLPVVVVFLVQ